MYQTLRQNQLLRSARRSAKQGLKFAIPKSLRAWIRAIPPAVSYQILKLSSRSPLLSSLYYAFFSPAFRRENHGVVCGKLRYAHDLKYAQYSDFLIRRNVHRLEKGLLMRPRRDIFARDFITETVESYKHALRTKSSPERESSEMQWAHDVLSQYFSIVGSEPTIDSARRTFLSLPALTSVSPAALTEREPEAGQSTHQNAAGRTPYKRDLETPTVSYDQLLQLSQRRRSVRWYLDRPVDRSLLDKAIEVATLSPSACNRQPFEFRIFDDPEAIAEISAVPMGTRGFAHNFPTIIVLVGKLSAYFDERDRHVIYIDASLAAMSFMYALETLGLSSCPINWPDIEAKEAKMAALLGLAPDERIVMLMSAGHPDPEGMVAYSQKKTLDQLRRYR